MAILKVVTEHYLQNKIKNIDGKQLPPKSNVTNFLIPFSQPVSYGRMGFDIKGLIDQQLQNNRSRFVLARKQRLQLH